MQFKMTFNTPAYSIALAIAGFIKEHRAVSDLDLVEVGVPTITPHIQFSTTRQYEDGRMMVVADSDPNKTHYSLVIFRVTGGLHTTQPVENFRISSGATPYQARTDAMARAARLSMDLGYPIKAV